MVRFMLAVVLAAAVTPTCAELPSLMPDTPERAPRAADKPEGLKSALRRFDAWRRGRLPVPLLGRLDYRLDDDELRAGFRWGATNVGTAFGYDGERRVELSWPAQGGRLRVVYGDHDGGAAGRSYRVEFAADL